MKLYERWWNPWNAKSGIACLALAAMVLASGCEKKEKVMEIHTPGLNLEINKTTSPTGDKGVEVKSNHGDKIEIDATNKKAD